MRKILIEGYSQRILLLSCWKDQLLRCLKIISNNLLHYSHIMFRSRDISIVSNMSSAILDIEEYAETSQVWSRNIFIFLFLKVGVKLRNC